MNSLESLLSSAFSSELPVSVDHTTVPYLKIIIRVINYKCLMKQVRFLKSLKIKFEKKILLKGCIVR